MILHPNTLDVNVTDPLHFAKTGLGQISRALEHSRTIKSVPLGHYLWIIA